MREKYKREVEIESNSFLVRLTCILISIIAIIYIAILGKVVLVPLILGFLISMILLPFSSFQEKKLKFPRIVSSLLSPILFASCILAIGYIIGTQMAHFTRDIPEFKEQLLELGDSVQEWVNDHFGVSQRDQIEFLSKNAEEALRSSTGFLGTAVTSITSILTAAAFVFLATFFFLYYRRHLLKFLVWTFPPRHEKKVKGVVKEVQTVIKQYIIGLFIQVIAVSTMMFIAYSIIGIKYALLFAILCGVLNLIPYIGVFTATILAAAITLVTGQPIDALWVIVAVIIVNSIDGNVITPMVIGSKVSLNSFVVLFGIIIAQSIWGIAGMFLAIPILAITKIIFDNVDDLRPYGFFLGEDDQTTPLFEEYYGKIFRRKKVKPTEGVVVDVEVLSQENEEQNSIEDK